MARKRYFGPYYAARDSRGYTYYVDRKTGKRVSSDIVGSYVRRRATEKRQVLKDLSRTADGRFVSRKDFEAIYNYLIRKSPEPVSREDVKDLIKNWTRDEFEDILEIALGLPVKSWWYVVRAPMGSRQLTLKELISWTNHIKASFYWTDEEKITSVRFRIRADAVADQAEEEYMAKHGQGAVYRIDIRIKLLADGSIRYTGDFRVYGSDGEYKGKAE
jgi:hypothetical protein